MTIKEVQNIISNYTNFTDALFNLTKTFPDIFCFLRIFKKVLNSTALNVEPLIELCKNSTEIMVDFNIMEM